MKSATADEVPDSRLIFVLLLVAAAGALVAFAHLPGTEDVPIFWVRWGNLVAQHGLREGYRQAFTDYPPGVFILFATANLLFGSLPTFALVKGIIILAAGGGVIVYGSWSGSLGWTVALLFAVLLSSVILAYIDVLYLAPLFASLWALQHRRIALASFCFTVAVAMKWQPLIIAPFFVLQATGFSLDRAMTDRSWIPAFGQLALGAIPPTALCLMLVEPTILWRAFSLATTHPALSLQALNANWLIELCLYAKQGGAHVYDVAVSTSVSGALRGVFYLVYGSVFAFFALRRRSFAQFVWFACVAFLVYFLINIGVHENHLFVPMVLAFALPCAGHPRSQPVAAFLAVMANVNLLLFYGLEGALFLRGPNMLAASAIFALVNVSFGVLCLVRIVKTTFPDIRPVLAGWREPALSAASPVSPSSR